MTVSLIGHPLLPQSNQGQDEQMTIINAEKIVALYAQVSPVDNGDLVSCVVHAACEMIATAKGKASCSGISKLTSIPRPTVIKKLQRLADRKMVVRLPEGGYICLIPISPQLGQRHCPNLIADSEPDFFAKLQALWIAQELIRLELERLGKGYVDQFGVALDAFKDDAK